MWAVVGLGNPGKKYSETRHNVGFLLVKRAARQWNAPFRKKRWLAKTLPVSKGSEDVVFVQPRTYMNRSGVAVRQVLEELGIQPEKLVLVYDDIDIPLGEIRVRKEGSPGTHRGVRSVVEEVGTAKFPRIRVGIGPLPDNRDATEYVLSRFTKEEKVRLEKSLEQAQNALEMILSGSIDRAMNLFNRKIDAREITKKSSPCSFS